VISRFEFMLSQVPKSGPGAPAIDTKTSGHRLAGYLTGEHLFALHKLLAKTQSGPGVHNRNSGAARHFLPLNAVLFFAFAHGGSSQDQLSYLPGFAGWFAITSFAIFA
jgi:hypothetical protein